ncbi:diguanylate cyclase [Dactylosporangium sp. NPDC050688]|uniref:diguanylate cyclase domain-containing protein n=1 Tax=Dactylosporangium sp. NPDC050688 TaxID=3157217 RepID=UPI0033FF0BB7
MRDRALLRDPVLLGLVGLTVAAVLWFLLGPGGTRSSWLIQTGLDVARVAALSGQIMAALSAPVDLDGRELRIGGSVGVATGPAGDPDRLLRDADAAMYRVKQDRKAAV